MASILLEQVEQIELILERVQCRTKNNIQQFMANAGLKNRIADALFRIGDEHIKKVHSFYSSSVSGVCRRQFSEALKEIRLDIENEEDISELFTNMDMNDDGYLDLVEFSRAVSSPSTAEQYIAHSIPFAKFVWAALPRVAGKSAFEAMMDLSPTHISEISHAISGHIESLLVEKITSLRKSQNAASAEMNQANATSKFTVVEMQGGNIDDYHASLSGRVGNPDLEFQKAMRAEHCTKEGSEIEFETTNYHIKTTPKREWSIVVDGLSPNTDENGHGRRIPDLDELQRLAVSEKSKLLKIEIISLVLYTGPLYMVYNTLLRRAPEGLFEDFYIASNLFPTTIHVLQSAVVKIARKTKIPENLVLYRGLSMRFPPHFYRCDENGCRGFAEWGFMSTTADRSIAMMYCGAREGKPMATVLQIRTSAVNRAACIQMFSQYQKEQEYLWVPLSYLQPEGSEIMEATDMGVVRLLNVGVSSNGTALTVDDLQERKKQLHLKTFESTIDGLEAELEGIIHAERDGEPTFSDCTVSNSVLEEARRVMESHSDMEADKYTDPGTFSFLNQQMLEIRRFGVSKVRYWLEAPTAANVARDRPMRTVHRLLVALRRKRLEVEDGGDVAGRVLRAQTVCGLMGLYRVSMDEQNEVEEPVLVQAAADNASPLALRLLIQAGAPLEGATPEGFTAVFRAAQYGNVDCLRTLLAERACVDPRHKQGSTPIFVAAQNGQCACIRLLAEARGDVQVADVWGTTPVMVAAQTGEVEAIALLHELGADVHRVDGKGSSALHMAAEDGQAEAVQVLLRLGVDWRVRRDGGQTPLDGVRELVEQKRQAEADGFLQADGVARLRRMEECIELLERCCLTTD